MRNADLLTWHSIRKVHESVMSADIQPLLFAGRNRLRTAAFLQCGLALSLLLVFVASTTLPLGVSFLRAWHAASQEKPDLLNAREILDRTAKVYAICRSYRDSGVARTEFIDVRRNWTSELHFTTAFVRPDRFRFAYREIGDMGSRYVIWRRGREVQTLSDIGGLRAPESLDLAIAAATGVSKGSARTIPALLLPHEIGGRRLVDLTEVKRTQDANLEGIKCFRIEGKYGTWPMAVYIDKSNFLIRRIVEHRSHGSANETVTTYSPAIDGVVSDDLLAFPPR